MIDRFHARCFKCAQDFFTMRHMTSHNVKFRDHEVQVFDHGSYNPKTGFKRTVEFDKQPLVRRLEELFKN